MKKHVAAAAVVVAFTLTACGGGGSSDGAPIVDAQPTGATKPSTRTASDIADTSASVGGTFTNPTGHTTSAWVEWGTSNAYGSSTSRAQYATLGSVSPSFTLSGLSTGATYHYRLCTSNTDGTWCGADQSVTTVAMAAKSTLVGGLSHPVQFAVSGDYVVWTEGAKLGSDGAVCLHTLSTGTTTTLASGLADPFGISTDGRFVYWTEPSIGEVKKVPLAGGAATVVATLNNPQSIAVSVTGAGTDLYVVEYGSWNSAAALRNPDGTIVRLAASGGTPARLATGLDGPSALSVTGGRVVWTEIANFVSGAGAVKSIGVDGSVPQVLASSLSNTQNLTADGSFVYFWSAYGVLSRVATSESVPAVVELASGMNGSPALVNDSGAVYWAEADGRGFLKRLDKASATVTVLTAGAVNTQGIAEVGGRLYWLEGDAFSGGSWQGSGAIRSIAKP